jgi:hypothetical protein
MGMLMTAADIANNKIILMVGIANKKNLQEFHVINKVIKYSNYCWIFFFKFIFFLQR